MQDLVNYNMTATRAEDYKQISLQEINLDIFCHSNAPKKAIAIS